MKLVLRWSVVEKSTVTKLGSLSFPKEHKAMLEEEKENYLNKYLSMTFIFYLLLIIGLIFWFFLATYVCSIHVFIFFQYFQVCKKETL